MATSQLHKAAVVLISLPEGQATRLLAELPAEQAAAVRAEMVRLGQLDPNEQRAAIEEFAAAGSAAMAGLGENRQPLQFLQQLKTDDLLVLLADEQPQTVALVLFFLPPRQAAEALDALPAERQASVVRRLVAIEQPDPDVLRTVEDGIKRAMVRRRIRPARRGMAGLVKMLHAMQPRAERRVLEEVAQADPGLHQRIRRAIFGPDVVECAEASA